jgi:3'(2'), 5'-bisphosphate nucleotidase
VANLQSIAGFPVESVLAIARSIGWGAADILQSYYHPNPIAGEAALTLNIQDQGDGPVTAADVAANNYILDNLHAAFGTIEFGYLTEETFKAQNPSERLQQTWVWIIDPLDGTKDFIKRTGEYAVHIALAHAGRPVLAVVVCPELAKLYYATLGGGTFVETRDGRATPLRVAECDRIEDLSVVVSGSHRGERLTQLLRQLPCQNQRAIGSVGCKIAAIAEQEADLYISLSGKSAPKDWDLAAPELILTEAGGKFTHFDGSLLQYNQMDVSQWGGLLASNGTCHTQLCAQAETLLAAIDTPA